MTEQMELIVAAYSTADKAKQVYKKLKSLKKENKVGLANAAILSRNAAGKFSVQESGDLSGKQGAAFGAIAGGLIGLLGGPAGVIAGAAAGAAAGGIAAEKIDMGFDNEILRQLSEDLGPDSSAIILLCEKGFADFVLGALDTNGTDLFHQTLSEKVSEDIQTQKSKEEQV